MLQLSVLLDTGSASVVVPVDVTVHNMDMELSLGSLVKAFMMPYEILESRTSCSWMCFGVSFVLVKRKNEMVLYFGALVVRCCYPGGE